MTWRKPCRPKGSRADTSHSGGQFLVRYSPLRAKLRRGMIFLSLRLTLRVLITKPFRRETLVLKQILALAALVSLAASGSTAAQPLPAGPPPTPIKRTLLQKVDVPTAN